jgi:proteic killer suppression protein
MIGSFKHRGLKRLYERDDRSGIRPDLLKDIEDILARLDHAATPQALNLGLSCSWSVTVRMCLTLN